MEILWHESPQCLRWEQGERTLGLGLGVVLDGLWGGLEVLRVNESKVDSGQ